MLKDIFKMILRLLFSWINFNIAIATLYIMINGDIGFGQVAICCTCLLGFWDNLKRGLE